MAGIRIVLLSGEMEERVRLKKAFLVEQNMEVVGESDNAEEGLKLIKDLNPSIVVIDSKLAGENSDGLAAAELISVSAPASDIIIISEEGTDGLFMRKAMLAGARQVIPKPYDPGDLIEIVKLVANISEKKKEAMAKLLGAREEEVVASKTVAIFSTKGGVGKTLLATNLACAIKKLTGKKVCLVDLDLQFGDVAIMMHLQPKNTIAGLAREIADTGVCDDEVLANHLLTHEDSGVVVLTAPVRPDEADLVKGTHIDAIVKKLKEKFHYIVIDTPAFLTDSVLTALELSDFIFLLLTMELPTIKDGKLMLEIMQTFGYTDEKVKIIMNREASDTSFKKADIEKALDSEIAATIPSEGIVIMPAVNEGEPFYIRSPDSKASAAINEIVKLIAADDINPDAMTASKPAKKSVGFFGKKKK